MGRGWGVKVTHWYPPGTRDGQQECEAAVVVGVNVMLAPGPFIEECAAARRALCVGSLEE